MIFSKTIKCYALEIKLFEALLSHWWKDVHIYTGKKPQLKRLSIFTVNCFQRTPLQSPEELDHATTLAAKLAQGLAVKSPVVWWWYTTPTTVEFQGFYFWCLMPWNVLVVIGVAELSKIQSLNSARYVKTNIQYKVKFC